MKANQYRCSKSTRKAEKSVQKLTHLLENVLLANPSLRLKMASLGRQNDDDDDASIRTNGTTSTICSWRTRMDPFEKVLYGSRVYTRAGLNFDASTFNLETSTIKTLETSRSNWSQLSGLSLSQISSVGVILLPITSSDVHNTTFDALGGASTPQSVLLSSAVAPPSPFPQYDHPYAPGTEFRSLTYSLTPTTNDPPIRNWPTDLVIGIDFGKTYVSPV